MPKSREVSRPINPKGGIWTDRKSRPYVPTKGVIAFGVLTIGTSPVLVPIELPMGDGLRMLCRAANAGNVFWGDSSSVTTSTGILLPKGAPGVIPEHYLPWEHFMSGHHVWLVADQADQIVEYRQH